jgi:hypothetical protein
MDTINIFVHNDVDICIKNNDKNYIYYHNEPCNPTIIITKSIYIYIPILSDSNLGVLIFVKDKNNKFKQYFFNKTILFEPLKGEIIFSHQIIVCKLNTKYKNIIHISAIDSAHIKYDCFLSNPNISLLTNGAIKILIEEMTDNKYCLEYDLEINNKKNIKLYYTIKEIKLQQSDNYIGKLKLVKKTGEQDYLTIPSKEIQDKNINDNQIITGNIGLYILIIIIMLLMTIGYINS